MNAECFSDCDQKQIFILCYFSFLFWVEFLLPTCEFIDAIRAEIAIVQRRNWEQIEFWPCGCGSLSSCCCCCCFSSFCFTGQNPRPLRSWLSRQGGRRPEALQLDWGASQGPEVWMLCGGCLAFACRLWTFPRREDVFAERHIQTVGLLDGLRLPGLRYGFQRCYLTRCVGQQDCCCSDCNTDRGHGSATPKGDGGVVETEQKDSKNVWETNLFKLLGGAAPSKRRRELAS